MTNCQSSTSHYLSVYWLFSCMRRPFDNKKVRNACFMIQLVQMGGHIMCSNRWIPVTYKASWAPINCKVVILHVSPELLLFSSRPESNFVMIAICTHLEKGSLAVFMKIENYLKLTNIVQIFLLPSYMNCLNCSGWPRHFIGLLKCWLNLHTPTNSSSYS